MWQYLAPIKLDQLKISTMWAKWHITHACPTINLCQAASVEHVAEWGYGQQAQSANQVKSSDC